MSDVAESPIRVSCNRADAVYRVGDEVRFLIEAVHPVAATTVMVKITWDGYAPVEEHSVPANDLPREIALRPDAPGFLRCAVTWDGLTSPQERPQAAAAISPEEIQPSLPEPDDFDEFWDAQLAAQSPMPANATVTPYTTYPEAVVHKVELPMPDGTTIYGWLFIPHSKPPYPGIVRLHGAGVYALPPNDGLHWPERGIMVFSLNSHPIPNDQPQEFYVGLRSGALADYRALGREDRQRIYFRGMFLRAARAVDFLASRPEWNGVHLIAEGHSQGGGQAIAAAGLNQKVNALVVSCATHCDHTGPVIGRVAGWPKLVEIKNGVPDPAHVAAARYVDGANFAARVKCPAFWSVSFLDDICPPTGNYAAFNRLRGPKTMRHDVPTAHIHTDECKAAFINYVTTHVFGYGPR